MSKIVKHSQVANTLWGVWQTDEGKYDSNNVQRAILLDIRAELQRLNSLLHCQNFLAIPRTLQRMDRRLAAKAPLRRRKKP